MDAKLMEIIRINKVNIPGLQYRGYPALNAIFTRIFPEKISLF